MSAIQNQLGALKGAAGKAMQHTSGTAKDKQLEGVTRYDAEKGNALTTNFGVKVASDDTTLYANGGGKQGPTLIAEDFHFREKVNHFDHERIPERVVHARGSAAHGTFKLTSDKLKAYTIAPVLTDTSRTTPVFTRFSTVLGSSGSSDTPRDVRGFAVKLYTQEGNWDIVGNNIPVFFIQDAIKFADVIHAGKPEPHNAIPQAQTAHDNFWDFISLSTEAAHMVMWTMADRTLPRTLRQMQGFGVNTFALVNSEGKRTLTKFHWAPLLGVHSTIWDETLKLGGADPDFQRRDLYESIESGAFPKWKFGVQLMDEADWDNHSFDPHDATKIWPEEDFPVHWVGEMELNRNPAEYFTEVEQVAFGTHHVVPGIDFSDDPLLQGRNFSYLDTQMSRLGGPNFNDIPINRPVCPVFNNQRDGMHRHTINASRVNYHPNRYDSPHVAKAPEGGFQHYAEKILAIKTKLAAPKFKEHFDQATLFYNSMSATEKTHIYQSLSFELGRVDDPTIRQRVVDNVLLQIDYDLAKAVAAEIDCTVPETAPKQNHGRSSKFLSQITSPYTTEHATAATRKVCIVIADGYDAKGVDAVRAALKAASCVTYIVSTRKGTIKAAGGGGDIKADFNIYGLRSVLFDGIIVPGGAQSIATLSKNGNAIGFVNEMWKHCKPVAGFGEGADFLKEASAGKWQGVTFDGKSSNVLGVITAPDAGDSTVGKIASAVGVGSGGAMAQFLDVLSKHRVWERETDNVPA